MGNIAPAVGRGKILVVEDDPGAARFAVYVLGERGGFDVTHLSDPVVATQHIADEHWDLVVADLDLPHMSGLDLLASVRRVAPGLPVALTTARAMDAVHTHALFSHADAFLEKPITPQRLIAVAATLIGSRRKTLGGAVKPHETPVRETAARETRPAKPWQVTAGPGSEVAQDDYQRQEAR